MRKTKMISRILAVILATTMLAGCTSKPASTPAGNTTSNPSSTAAPEKEFVKLKFYMNGSPVNEIERVMAKANEIIKREINAELEFVMSDKYGEKINMMITAGEEFDLCFMANWGDCNYFENAAKGAFVDMTDMLKGSETYSRIPEGLWEGVKVNDKIYGSINYQQWGTAARKGFRVRLDMADEFGYDWKAMKGKDTVTVLNSFTPFFEKVKAKYPEMVCWETSSNYSFFSGDPLYWDFQPVGDQNFPGWISYNDPTKVVNQFESEEFKQYVTIMREWYNKGFVRKDGATLVDATPDRKAGKIVAQQDYGWPDFIDNPPTGVEELTLEGFKAADYTIADMSLAEPAQSAPAINFSTTRTILPAGAGPTAMVSISRTSKNPERAFELIELLNTNDELFNLIQMGEEGVDYNYDADGVLQFVENKYMFNWNEWQIGQSYSPDFSRSFFNKNQQGEDQKAKCNVVFAADKTATPSPTSGFIFDPTSVKTEISNCSSIITEMLPGFSNGSIDPETNLDKFIKRLDDAGANVIVAEKQKQYDAFLAQKG